MTENPFKLGDVVVVKTRYAYPLGSTEYDYSAWGSTRMEVTLADGNMTMTKAIDQRPDFDWIMRTKHLADEGNPQDCEMSWPTEQLQLHS